MILCYSAPHLVDVETDSDSHFIAGFILVLYPDKHERDVRQVVSNKCVWTGLRRTPIITTPPDNIFYSTPSSNWSGAEPVGQKIRENLEPNIQGSS